MNGNGATVERAETLARNIREASTELRAELPGAGPTLETIVTATLADAEQLLRPPLVDAVDLLLDAPAGRADLEAVDTAKQWMEWANDFRQTLEQLKQEVTLAKQERAIPA